MHTSNFEVKIFYNDRDHQLPVASHSILSIPIIQYYFSWSFIQLQMVKHLTVYDCMSDEKILWENQNDHSKSDCLKGLKTVHMDFWGVERVKSIQGFILSISKPIYSYAGFYRSFWLIISLMPYQPRFYTCFACVGGFRLKPEDISIVKWMQRAIARLSKSWWSARKL